MQAIPAASGASAYPAASAASTLWNPAVALRTVLRPLALAFVAVKDERRALKPGHRVMTMPRCAGSPRTMYSSFWKRNVAPIGRSDASAPRPQPVALHLPLIIA